MAHDMLYMLDTNTISHIIKGTSIVAQQSLKVVPMAQLCISAVTEGELRYGLARLPDASKLQALVREFLLRIDSMPWDSKVSAYYGDLRARQERMGKPLGNLDMMIAAHALALGAVLVTNDRAFAHIEGLQLVDWTQ